MMMSDQWEWDADTVLKIVLTGGPSGTGARWRRWLSGSMQAVVSIGLHCVPRDLRNAGKKLRRDGTFGTPPKHGHEPWTMWTMCRSQHARRKECGCRHRCER